MDGWTPTRRGFLGSVLGTIGAAALPFRAQAVTPDWWPTHDFASHPAFAGWRLAILEDQLGVWIRCPEPFLIKLDRENLHVISQTLWPTQRAVFSAIRLLDSLGDVFADAPLEKLYYLTPGYSLNAAWHSAPIPLGVTKKALAHRFRILRRTFPERIGTAMLGNETVDTRPPVC